MRFHYRSLDNVCIESSAVTIGSFDGVHLGHQLIVAQLIDYAKLHQIPSVVINFFPHPLIVMKRVNEPFYLSYPEERAEIFFKHGVDHVITVNFTEIIVEKTTEQFMDWINSHLGVKHLCVGEDFGLGKDRKGNAAALSELGYQMGYETQIIPSVTFENEKISSSQIRNLIRVGEITKANSLLGRPYTLNGSGKRIIEPDQNISSVKLEFTHKPLQIVPAAGSYTGIVTVRQCTFPSIIQIQTPLSNPGSSIEIQISLQTLEMQTMPMIDQEAVKIEFLFRLDSPDLELSDPKMDEIKQRIKKEL